MPDRHAVTLSDQRGAAAAQLREPPPATEPADRHSTRLHGSSASRSKESICFCSSSHPIAGVLTLRSEPIVPWGKRGEVHVLAAHMFTWRPLPSYWNGWHPVGGPTGASSGQEHADWLPVLAKSLITLQKWWSGEGSNCRPSAFFRITDHHAGPATEVSLPAQRPAIHAVRRQCT
jgi:hypothetical protein